MAIRICVFGDWPDDSRGRGRYRGDDPGWPWPADCLRFSHDLEFGAMGGSIRVFIFHRHSLFRDLVMQALVNDARVEVIGATDRHDEANRWVRSASPAAAIVELDPDFATSDDLRELFRMWSAEIPRFAVLGAGFTQAGVDVYVHRTEPARPDGIAEALCTALDG